MIIKRRTKPLALQKLEALTPRLTQYFPKLESLRKDAAILNKGYIGEKKIDYYLEQLSSETIILQDVCLRLEGRNFQVDTIIITDYAIYCIECKHIKGTITFDTILNQFTQDNGITEKGYRYPITQAEGHQLQLTNWLHEHNLHNFPVHYFIAISDPSTIIHVIGDQKSIAKVVAHGEYIPTKIRKTDQFYKEKQAKKLPKQQIGAKILQKVYKRDFNILKKYHVKIDDLLTGVKCLNCNRLGMMRSHGIWICTQCENRSKYAHKQALSDYLLLVKPWIRNHEAMWFMGLESRYVTKRLLKISGLIYNTNSKKWVRE